MSTKTSKPPVSRDRKLVMLSATLLLIAAGVFGGVFLLQWQSVHAQPSRIKIPRLTDAEEATIVTRAKWLRERWEPWARTHKSELEQMLHAAPTDQAALMQVYDQIPDGLELSQLGIPSGSLIKSDASFTWPVNGKRAESKLIWKDTSKRDDPARLDRGRKADSYEVRMRQEGFTHFHNIAVARSMNRGVVNITVWANGRITRDTSRFNSASAFPEQEDAVQELVPAYDFIH